MTNHKNDPIARLTNLGWVCFDPTLVEEFRRNTHSHFTSTYRRSQRNKPPPPDDILRAFWELESLGIVDKHEQRMTAEERQLLKYLRLWRSGKGDTGLEFPGKKANRS